MLELSTSLRFVKRIGDRVATELARRDLHTVEDLLYHLPFRYEDRLHPQPIGALTAGTTASVIGEVRGSSLLRTARMPLFELTVGEGTSALKAIWFNGTYLKDRFPLGARVALYGPLEASRSSSGRLKMMQPQFELLPSPDSPPDSPQAKFAALEVDRIVPVYESLGGTTAWGARLTSRWLRRVLWSLLEELSPSSVPETLPPALLARLQLPSRLDALRAVHFPPAGTLMPDLTASNTPAHRRLIFEEFFFLELGLELKRRRLRERIGTSFVTDKNVRSALKQILPFHPTAAQKRVLAEIATDMRSPQPMRRLLQGDVGSGKTIVALQAALIAIENGYQVALMAPTEILATQHFLAARKLLADAVSPRTGRPYRSTLLTGSLDDRTRRNHRRRISTGAVDLAIGTHALVQSTVAFHNLGLVIIDEQHRFGVQQRFKLMSKPNAAGEPHEPDTLVMTATPIPRTLALTLYGDLETSVIDELPPGRTPITTRRTTHQRSDDVWAFVRKQVAAGRQAYIVYPIIEGTTDDQAELDFAHDPEPSTPVTAKTPSSRPKRSEVERPLYSASAAPKAKVSLTAANRTTAQHPAPDPVAAKLIASVTTKGTKLRKRSTSKQQPTPQPLFPKQPLRAATDMYDELRHGALASLRLGLLHGRLSAAEKDIAMRQFARGDLDVLITTTVIEVGVDVPNATLMVIEHADRFGLAQLHQLRGRVGRGAHKSFCLLVTSDRVSEAAEARLDAMVSTTDGFALAEFDLEQRGPGEFFGTRQAGAPELRVASLLRDRPLLELARTEATRFAADPDPDIPADQREAVWTRLREQWQRRYGLIEA